MEQFNEKYIEVSDGHGTTRKISKSYLKQLIDETPEHIPGLGEPTVYLKQPKLVGWPPQPNGVPIDRAKEPPLAQQTHGYSKYAKDAVEELNKQYEKDNLQFSLKEE